jgi:hypothetical protein
VRTQSVERQTHRLHEGDGPSAKPCERTGAPDWQVLDLRQAGQAF